MEDLELKTAVIQKMELKEGDILFVSIADNIASVNILSREE